MRATSTVPGVLMGFWICWLNVAIMEVDICFALFSLCSSAALTQILPEITTVSSHQSIQNHNVQTAFSLLYTQRWTGGLGFYFKTTSISVTYSRKFLSGGSESLQKRCARCIISFTPFLHSQKSPLTCALISLGAANHKSVQFVIV